MGVVMTEGVEISPSARISVIEYLHIGAGSVIGANCEISGRDVRIGNDFWMDSGAVIGGGSCYEPQSSFRAGDFLHMGRDSFINTARAVVIGDEVGLGTRTAIYTHGAYLSVLDGFPVDFGPVTIGSRVWIPGAIVNPGVDIGNDVVVGVNSLVTKSIPSGSLAAGSPAKVLFENRYPSPMSPAEKTQYISDWLAAHGFVAAIVGELITTGTAVFNIDRKTVDGRVNFENERLRNELRRYGIRFRAHPVNGKYQSW